MLPQDNRFNNDSPTGGGQPEAREPALVRSSRSKTPRIIALVILGIVLISMIMQFLYPKDRALPSAKLNGESVARLSVDEISERVKAAANDPQVQIKTPKEEVKTAWSALGIRVDPEATAQKAVTYEWWERLIPFSLVGRMIAPPNSSYVTKVDESVLAQFSLGFTELDQQSATEPKIAIENGSVTLTEGENGYAFDPEKVAQQIKAAPFGDGTVIELSAEELLPKNNKQAAEDMTRRIEQMLQKDISLKFAGQDINPDTTTIGSWLVVRPDAETGLLRVDTDKTKLRAYLESVAKKHSEEPNTVVVTLLDGNEVGRTTAAQTESMNIDKTLPVVSAGLLDGREKVALDIPVELVDPKERVERQYSRTANGLQAYLNDWAKLTGGDLGVVVRELGGQGITASVNADKPFVTASTYKMFLAYTVLKKMDEGTIKGGQYTGIGWRVDDCIVEMILKSTNDCAIALQNLVGWEEVDRMLAAIGLSDTRLNNLRGGDKMSTPRDEAEFLAKLHDCTIMSKKRCDYLLNIMRQQIFRTGIPAGVPAGVKVTNKVGFLGNYLHDVAIVYGPNTTYILTVMSHRYPPPDIPGLSNRIYAFFEG